MPIERSLVKEPIVFHAHGINDAMNDGNTDKDTVLPINARIV